MYTTAGRFCGDASCDAFNEGYKYDFFSGRYYCDKHFTIVMDTKNELLQGYPTTITIENQLIDILQDTKISFFSNEVKNRNKINAYLEYFFGKPYDYFKVDLNKLLPVGYVFKLMCAGCYGHAYDIVKIGGAIIAGSPLCTSERLAKLCSLISGWKYMINNSNKY